MLSRRQRREATAAHLDGEDREINVYRKIPCAVDRALLDRWSKAEGILKIRAEELKVALDWAAYQTCHDEFERLAKTSDTNAAFGALCRAMSRLIKGLNDNRGKSEVFQPVWDK